MAYLCSFDASVDFYLGKTSDTRITLWIMPDEDKWIVLHVVTIWLSRRRRIVGIRVHRKISLTLPWLPVGFK